jgi:hypothetical protein
VDVIKSEDCIGREKGGKEGRKEESVYYNYILILVQQLNKSHD